MDGYKFCQSCGMPMKKDPKHGVHSHKYCSYCYADGKFLNDSINSAKEMQQLCIEKMHEQGTPKILGWFLTRGIPKLERWSNEI